MYQYFSLSHVEILRNIKTRIRPNSTYWSQKLMKLQLQLEFDFSLHLRLVCNLRSVAAEISAFPLTDPYYSTFVYTGAGCLMRLWNTHTRLWKGLEKPVIGVEQRFDHRPLVLSNPVCSGSKISFWFPQLQLDSQGMFCSFFRLKCTEMSIICALVWCPIGMCPHSVATVYQQLLEMAGLSIFIVSFLVNADGGQG